MKKKFAVVSLLLAGILILTACGGTKSEGDKPAPSPIRTEPVEIESINGWAITYDPNLIQLSEEGDEVLFSYTRDNSDIDTVSICYIADTMPQQALYERAGDTAPECITRSEGFFASTGEWAFYYQIAPAQADDPVRQITGLEHNGGTLLVDILSHPGTDAESAADILSALVDTIKFTNHSPQEQFAYVPGTYYQTVTEEIDDQEVTYLYSVELNDNHTGTLHLQDDIDITWSSWQLITADTSYEYTIEGDSLLLNMGDDNWENFSKTFVEGGRDIVDADFSEYAGTYTSENEDTLTIDESGNVTICIIRLTQMEGYASGVSRGVMPITVTDASGNPMKLEFLPDSKQLIVTDSTWSLLSNGESFLLDK